MESITLFFFKSGIIPDATKAVIPIAVMRNCLVSNSYITKIYSAWLCGIRPTSSPANPMVSPIPTMWICLIKIGITRVIEIPAVLIDIATHVIESKLIGSEFSYIVSSISGIWSPPGHVIDVIATAKSISLRLIATHSTPSG